LKPNIEPTIQYTISDAVFLFALILIQIRSSSNTQRVVGNIICYLSVRTL